MKKLLFILTALCLAIAPLSAANQSKQLKKAKEKERKEKLKTYKKEGWKIFASSHTLEVALLEHWQKLEELGENGQEVAGNSTRTKSKNVGHQMAINSACINYAQRCGSHVKGKVASDMAGDGIDTDAEFEHFYAAYGRNVEKEIRGEMKESLSVIRDNGDGTFEVESYFIVNEKAAHAARLRALEQTKRETELAQEYADRIAAFIDETPEEI